jgi:Fic family protein
MLGDYLHLKPEWPRYRWDASVLAVALADIHVRRGTLSSAMAALGFESRQQEILQVIVQDVTRSSEIEGEHLDHGQVRSSIARRLGIACYGLPEPTRDVDGVVEMMLDATQGFREPLTEERLSAWHASLFPTGMSGMTRIITGAYRDDSKGPMQVVSGPVGRDRIHFQAPDASRLPAEMARFINWFEEEQIDPVVKAAIAHLWFVTIHPFEDGNGRIGRAIMDMALSRADSDSQRFYSMTAQIHKERKQYYAELERASKDTLDVTPWLVWFVARLSDALSESERVVNAIRRKQNFWDIHQDSGLNERQSKIVNLLLDGFSGKLQTAKYAKITKCSNDTALRDLSDLVSKGILVKSDQGGRSTSYDLAIVDYL